MSAFFLAPREKRRQICADKFAPTLLRHAPKNAEKFAPSKTATRTKTPKNLRRPKPPKNANTPTQKPGNLRRKRQKVRADRAGKNAVKPRRKIRKKTTCRKTKNAMQQAVLKHLLFCPYWSVAAPAPSLLVITPYFRIFSSLLAPFSHSAFRFIPPCGGIPTTRLIPFSRRALQRVIAQHLHFSQKQFTIHLWHIYTF